MPQTSDLNQSDPVSGTLRDDAICIEARQLPNAKDALRAALFQHGFVFLDGVFAKSDVLTKTLRQAETFFHLEDDDPRKQAVNGPVSDGERGWTPMYQEPAYQPGTKARMESFDCGRPEQRGYPSANVWPRLPEFESDVCACWQHMAAAGEAVLVAIADLLGLEPRCFADRCDTQELSTLRLLHYPAGKERNEPNHVGIAAHTDFECITLLLQTAPGLELRSRAGEWLDAPSRPDRVVVLLGDMLERWTNGQLVATGHRVRDTDQQRFSIVMFVAVNDDEIVAPLAAFADAGDSARYPATRQRDHLQSEVATAVRHRDAASQS